VYNALVTTGQVVGLLAFYTFIGYAMYLAVDVFFNTEYVPAQTSVTVIVIEGTGSQEVVSNPAPVFISIPKLEPQPQAVQKFKPQPEPVRNMEVPNVVKGVKVSDELLYALAMKESNRKNNKIGDRHLRHKAYYMYQIRWPYLNDVNRTVGRRRMIQLWGKPAFTLADMKDTEKAEWVVKQYLAKYGLAYHRETGKAVTNEVLARIHNGGPDGWKEYSTYAYWEDVRAIVANQ
jgi:hypothetical protein